MIFSREVRQLKPGRTRDQAKVEGQAVGTPLGQKIATPAMAGSQ